MVDYSKYRLRDLKKHADDVNIRPFDVMITGATGSGKSTTLNALFGKEISKPGTGSDPETMEISKHYLNDYIRFWDTPGLGDDPEADRRHSQKIRETLRMEYSETGRYKVIDAVVIVIDASSRDLGTAYHLIEDVILPEISQSRVFVVMNRADMAMSGRHFYFNDAMPDSVLERFLNEKTTSVKRRVKETTGLSVPHPVAYSAMYKYNLTEVLDLLINNVPHTRRIK